MDSTFDWRITLARVYMAVSDTLPLTGGVAWGTNDLRMLAMGAGAAALAAVRVDVDAWIKAKAAMRQANAQLAERGDKPLAAPTEPK